MTSDHTVDADETELERIRQLAAAAEADARQWDGGRADDGVGYTVDADDDTLDQIKRLAAEAQVSADAAGAVSAWAPPVSSRRLPNRSVASLELVDTPSAPRPSEPTSVDRWQPPARSMRPEREQPTGPDHARPWRLATAVLAVMVVALIALWLFVGRGGDAPEPSTSTVPGNTAPAGVPVTGVQGEGGSGG